MNTAFRFSQSGHGSAANDQSGGNDVPPDDDHVAVMASRASVIAAAVAMGHKPADDGRGEEPDDGTEGQANPGDKKKGRDKNYQRTERQADAKAGIKACPVKFPANLHRPLRERVHESNAPDGSRALLALTSFTLRPEFTAILHAIELRDDRESLVKALQRLVQTDWLVKATICLSELATDSTTSEHEQVSAVAHALVRDPTLSRAILAVAASPTLQKLCIEMDGRGQLQNQFLYLTTRPKEAELAFRMSRLSASDRDFLQTLLNLDADSKRAIAAAAPYPEITRLIVKAGRQPLIHGAIQAVVRNPEVAKTGLAVVNGKGFLGWMAKKVARVLLNRQQKDRR